MKTYICDHADPEFSCYGCPHSLPHEEFVAGKPEENYFSCTSPAECIAIGCTVKCVEWENDNATAA